MSQWLPSLSESAGGTTVLLRMDPTIWRERPPSAAAGADCTLGRRFVDDGVTGTCTLTIGLLPAFGRRLERLYLLTRADTTGADELEIEHRPDEGFGRSVRVLRHDLPDAGQPGSAGSCAVRQAWRLSPAEDLLVALVAPDAAALCALLREFENVVGALRVELREARAQGDAFTLAQGA
jgi:hypothetical protein